MQNAETVLGVLRERGRKLPAPRRRSLESHVPGNWPAWFGGRPRGKGPAHRRAPRRTAHPVPDRDGNGTGELVVLLTSVTDPADARADELAVAYNERWEQETGHDQLKTHLRGPGKILRSRLPELVYQEIYAYLIVHHAISALIAKASAAADLDPDRISFADTLRLIRRSATGTADIPPCGLG